MPIIKRNFSFEAIRQHMPAPTHNKIAHAWSQNLVVAIPPCHLNKYIQHTAAFNLAQFHSHGGTSDKQPTACCRCRRLDLMMTMTVRAQHTHTKSPVLMRQNCPGEFCLCRRRVCVCVRWAKS